MELTTKQVSDAVRVAFGNYEHPIHNSFIFDWESDFFAISKSGYSVEVEVKVSRADFKKDFTKADKHKILTRHQHPQVCLPFGNGLSSEFKYNPETKKHERYSESSMIKFIKPVEHLPNKFFYACPEGLIRPEEVPAYAGLIYSTGNYQSYIVKQAPFLHKNKKCFDNILLGKYYHRNNEISELLGRYLRSNNLTDQQERDLAAIHQRFR